MRTIRGNSDVSRPATAPHDTSGSFPATGSEAPGERRQLTVMFCDLVGSTSLSGRLDPEDLREVIRSYQEVSALAIARFDGYLAQYLGDGVLAYFGYPIAHEDDPARAIRAGLAIVEGTRRLHLSPGGAREGHLQVRVGIHTGLVVAGEMGAGDTRQPLAIVGEAPNIAARLQGLAAPNTLVVSDVTYRLVQGQFECEELGLHEIKGVANKIALHRVLASRMTSGRFEASKLRGLAPLIGRQAEMESLHAAWRGAASGTQIVNVTGDAGIGKSRIVHEFASAVSRESHVLHTRCTSDGKSTPFFPLLELMRASLGLGGEGQPIEAELDRGLARLGITAAEHAPYLRLLLGQPSATRARADPEVIGRGARLALLEILKTLPAPTLIVIDDVHWIDSASEECLTWATSPERGLKLLLLCTSRPERRPAWSHQPNVVELSLGPLDREGIVELARARLGATRISSRLEALVVEKAQGNPLFAEELALQASQCAADPNRSRQLEPDLPVTLENLLMERISVLREGPRKMLQAAAVAGQRFDPRLVVRIANAGDGDGSWFEELLQEGLVVQAGEAHLAFRHALIRDAAYQNLLKKRREELHERAARCIEADNRERLGDVADTLADHYARTRHADKAVAYLAQAGERSLKLYSLDEAESRFDSALDLMRRFPGSADEAAFVDVLLKKARILYFRADMRGLMGMADEHQARVEALGDRKRLARFLFEVGYAHVFAARHDVGRSLLERALALGEEAGDDEATGYASLGLAWHYGFWGRPEPGRYEKVVALGTRAAEAGRRLNEVWLVSKALLCLSVHAGVWGRTGDGVALNGRLMALAEETRDPRPQGMALYSHAMMNVQRGDIDSALEQAEGASRAAVSTVDRMFASMAKAMALARGVSPAAGRESLEALRAQMERSEFRIVALLTTELPFGVALIQSGSLMQGLRHIGGATRRYQALGQPFARCYGELALGRVYAAIALRVRGTQKGGQAPGWKSAVAWVISRVAERHFNRSVEESRRLEIGSRLAEALMYLGELHAARGLTLRARSLFQEARVRAQGAEASYLLERIEAADALIAQR